jgi:hypothetical protein
LIGKDGKALEIRFNKGFEGKLGSGIGINSSGEEVRKAYGEPAHQKKTDTAEKWEYTEKGVLFWITKGRVTQIVVFAPCQPGK